jgi:hypothetical protein
MVFQFYGGYRGGGMFGNFVYWLDYWGVRDIILPFILIFTIFFAVLQKIDLFHSRDKEGKPVPGSGKKYNVALALAISLLTIIPHATGAYPAQYDVVNIINDSIPEVALLVIVVVLLLMLVGLGFGPTTGIHLTGWIALIAGIMLVAIFVNNLFPMPVLQYIDPSIQALIVILLVFGLVVWFVTREPGSSGETLIEKLMKPAVKGP